MTEHFTTTLTLTESGAMALCGLLADFDDACASAGIWIHATTSGDLDGQGSATITLSLSIDEAWRVMPGPDRKPMSISLDAAEAMMDAGISPGQVAARAGISRATLYRRIASRKQKPVNHVY